MDTLDPQSIVSLMNLMSRGGGGDQSFGTPLSGIPPLAYLSGLNLGQGALSGTPDASSMSGSGASARGLVPGHQAGPGLEFFQPSGGETTDTSGAANLGALGSLIGGSIGAQQVGQFGGQGFQTAGNTSPTSGSQGYTQAGQTAGTTADPAALLAKILGLGKSIAGIGASPTQGDSLPLGLTQSDISGSNPNAFAQQRAGERTASPYVTPSFSFPNAQGSIGPTGTLLPGEQPPPGFNTEFLGQTEEGGAAANSGLGTNTMSGGVGAGSGGGGGIASPTNNLSGAIQGGLGGGIGLLNLISGLQSGNVPQGIGGGLQGIGGLSQLLQNSPQLAEALGLGGLGTAGSGLGNLSALGTAGGVAGGLGGLLGLVGGVQGLVNGTGTPTSEATQLGGGALGTYGALSTLFPEAFPSLTGLIGSGISSLAGTALGNALGIGAGEAAGVGAGAGAGAAGAGAAGAGASAGAAGAGAAGAAGTAIAAAPIAALYLATQIQGMLDSQHAAYGAQENYRKLTGDLPQAIQSLQGLPAAFNLMPRDGAATPDQALAEINAVNKIIDPWLNSGLYDFTESGQTRAGGGSLGQDAVINFPQGPNIFNRIFSPAFNAAEQALIPAYDVLGRSGQSAISQIPGFDPASITGLNFSPYNLGLQEIQRLNPNFQLVPSPEAIAAAGPTPWDSPPPGFSFYGGQFIPTDVMGDLLKLQDTGGLMSGINDIVAKERSGGYAPIPTPQVASGVQPGYDPTTGMVTDPLAYAGSLAGPQA